MYENDRRNRYSLTMKSAASKSPAPTAAPDSAVRPPPILRRRPFENSNFPSTRGGGGGGIPTLWSCGIVVGVIFCVMNERVNALPLEDSPIKKRSERSTDSISEQNLDQMALDWFLKRGTDRKSTLRNLRSRVSRSIGDQIIAEMEQEWLADQQSGARPSSRTRRFAMEKREDEEAAVANALKSLVRHRLRQSQAKSPLLSRLDLGGD